MITREPLGAQVYREIGLRIQSGQLGADARIRDTELAAELGVSRTPVREALLRLAGEGVLAAEAGRGFRVRALDRVELREVGAILALLEPLALDLSPEFSPDRLDRMGAVVRRLEQTRGDIGRCIELDDEWHRILLEACPNRRLLDLITTLRRIPRRYLHHYLEQAGRVSLSAGHHARIGEALRRGDRHGARDLLERQWRRGLAEIESVLP